MKYPTVKQLERMIWGFKLVGVDLHTRGTDRPPYRYTESTTLPAGWTVNASGLVVKDPS